MEFRIWVETRLAGRILERHNVATVERTEYPFAPEEIGLNLEEGKSLLRQVQTRMVQTQVDILGAAERSDADRVRRFREHLVNLRDYLCRNWSWLTNYARERRQGLRVSSAPAESAMSHLVNQRMGKRQPMRWSISREVPGLSCPPSSATCSVTPPMSDPVPVNGTSENQYSRSHIGQ